MVAPPVARAGAIHVVLLGRASSPAVEAGGCGCGGFGVGGPGEPGGGSCTAWPSPSLPPPQPVMSKAKDTNIPVACPARDMEASSYLFSVRLAFARFLVGVTP